AVALRRGFESFDETSADFVRPVGWEDGREVIDGLASRLARAERAIDRIVAEAYGLQCDEPIMNEVVYDPAPWARRWVSYAVGSVLGRWGPARREVISAGDVRPVVEELA